MYSKTETLQDRTHAREERENRHVALRKMENTIALFSYEEGD